MDFLEKWLVRFMGGRSQLQKALTVAVANRDGVVAPPATMQRYKLGDETVIEFVEGLFNTRRRRTLRVTFADSNRAEINNGELIYDQAGVLLKDNYGVRSPGKLEAPSDMAVGKKWKTAYENIPIKGPIETNFVEYEVVGLETVKVPEGTFKAYKVIGRGESRSISNFHRIESKAWYDSTSFRLIRLQFSFHEGLGTTANVLWESVSFKRIVD